MTNLACPTHFLECDSNGTLMCVSNGIDVFGASLFFLRCYVCLFFAGDEMFVYLCIVSYLDYIVAVCAQVSTTAQT